MSEKYAEKTGQYVVCIFEPGNEYVLAVHGPYTDAESARRAAGEVRPGDRGEAFPLWNPAHVGRL